MLQLGATAPDFRATDQAGVEHTLASLLATGPVVLYFYPKDFTLVCTRQACAFRDEHTALVSQGVKIVGVSRDTVESHRRFADAHQVPFPLLADPNQVICRAYDVLGLLGLVLKRVTYVIDQGSVIRGVFHHELSAGKHLEDVRASLEALRSRTAQAK